MNYFIQQFLNDILGMVLSLVCFFIILITVLAIRKNNKNFVEETAEKLGKIAEKFNKVEKK